MRFAVDLKNNLYVIPAGKGYTCLGFDVCVERTRKLALEFGEEVPVVPDGEVSESFYQELYHRYSSLCDRARARFETTGEQSTTGLTHQLKGLEGKKVKVVDREGHDRVFIVGKSTGPIPCHLEIKTRRSNGGFAVTGAPFKSVTVIGE